MGKRVMRTILPANRFAVTFIELLIILVIIAVLSVLSAPLFKNTTSDLELESFIKDLYYLCRFLQESASAEGAVFCLNISRDSQENGNFWASYYSQQEEEFKKPQGRYARAYNVPSRVSFLTEPADTSFVYFYPDGCADNATIIFRNNRNRQISLIIQAGTGDIKIQ